ncbi:hypothetical protein GGR53DRAFT_466972 [Hypoxylon sp. FL1150]|nr:hypothetical protein GGR53DRAFT_466972 [Hypoxylon sp. FL1150]
MYARQLLKQRQPVERVRAAGRCSRPTAATHERVPCCSCPTAASCNAYRKHDRTGADWHYTYFSISVSYSFKEVSADGQEALPLPRTPRAQRFITVTNEDVDGTHMYDGDRTRSGSVVTGEAVSYWSGMFERDATQFLALHSKERLGAASRL